MSRGWTGGHAQYQAIAPNKFLLRALQKWQLGFVLFCFVLFAFCIFWVQNLPPLGMYAVIFSPI